MLNRDAALKVNTDGVLLAAWAELESESQVLDIGTGSGVIALILKDRYATAKITAIDIDEKSINEARSNFLLNNFNIETHLCAFQELNTKTTFDHFVCNPPFFQNSTVPDSPTDFISKHNESLTPEDFWSKIASISRLQSTVQLIIPFVLSSDFDKLASACNFKLKRECLVQGKENGPVIRVLKQYKKNYTGNKQSDQLFIRKENSNDFGEKYRTICKDLYLKF